MILELGVLIGYYIFLILGSPCSRSLSPSNKELENLHDQDFIDKVRIVKDYGFYNEFLDAANEEEQGPQKIIEAYDKRRKESM